MNMIIEKPSKKSLWYLGAVLIIAILVGIGYFYYLSKTEIKMPEEKKSAEENMREIIKSLTAPEEEGEGKPVSQKVKQSLSAPSQETEEVSEDILKSLSAPK